MDSFPDLSYLMLIHNTQKNPKPFFRNRSFLPEISKLAEKGSEHMLDTEPKVYRTH